MILLLYITNTGGIMSNLERVLYSLIQKRSFEVCEDWTEILAEYESLAKAGFARKKKSKRDGWVKFEVTHKAEKLHQKIKGKR